MLRIAAPLRDVDDGLAQRRVTAKARAAEHFECVPLSHRRSVVKERLTGDDRLRLLAQDEEGLHLRVFVQSAAVLFGDEVEAAVAQLRMRHREQCVEHRAIERPAHFRRDIGGVCSLICRKMTRACDWMASSDRYW